MVTENPYLEESENHHSSLPKDLFIKSRSTFNASQALMGIEIKRGPCSQHRLPGKPTQKAGGRAPILHFSKFWVGTHPWTALGVEAAALKHRTLPARGWGQVQEGTRCMSMMALRGCQPRQMVVLDITDQQTLVRPRWLKPKCEPHRPGVPEPHHTGPGLQRLPCCSWSSRTSGCQCLGRGARGEGDMTSGDFQRRGRQGRPVKAGPLG